MGARRKSNYFSFKGDMSKAYDREAGSFLLQALKLLGLTQQFINLVKAYICTFHIRVIINREVDSFFCPRSGLCQGCEIHLEGGEEVYWLI